MKPIVSVIIPTKNAGSTLASCLDSLTNQGVSHEIIIVDNHSTDETVAIAHRYTSHVYTHGPERVAQKYYGIQRSTGQYLLLIDADMVLQAGLLQDCIDRILSYNTHHTDRHQRTAAGVCLPIIDRGTSRRLRVITRERSLYAHTAIEAARFLDGDLIRSLPANPSSIIFFEEFFHSQYLEQQGYEVHLQSTKHLYHLFYEFSLRSYLRKKRYYGQSVIPYHRQHPQTSGHQLSPWQRYWILIRQRCFWMRPHYGLALLLLKTMEYTAGGGGVLYYLYKQRGNNDETTIKTSTHHNVNSKQ